MTGTVIAPVRRSRLLLAVLLLAMLVAPMAQTAVMPMLPALAGEFGVSASAVSWVMTANLLAAAVGTPLFGRLGDLRGLYGSFIAISSLAQTPRESGITTTALGAGLMLLPSAAGNLLAGMTGGVLLNRFGSRPIPVLGGILSAAGVALLVIETPTVS
ncbi:MFS transporter [Nocardia ninae]|nr:MFS transporter [Nocardia ninae]